MFQFFQKPWPMAQPCRRKQPLSGITLAVSAAWRHGSGRLDWIAANGLHCAYTPDAKRLDLISEQLASYIQQGMHVRHHAFFPGKEIGHANPEAAEDAMQFHFKALEAICNVDEKMVTVHVGLDPATPLDHHRAVLNLTRLVRYGEKMGVAVSLENLRTGPTANPQTLLDWARRSNARITLDIGHAVSSPCVDRKEISVEQIVGLAAGRLVEVHFYESETDRHWAPQNMDILGPVVDELICTDCRWWTIELEDLQDVIRTRQLLAAYLATTENRFFTNSSIFGEGLN
jgi:sugar phosphate isomerase/epimerase